MKTVVLAVLGVALPSIALAQSPTYEVQGFPLSLHQAQVSGFAEVREQVAAPNTEYKGFLASPAQMLVLTPRTMSSASIESESLARASQR